jgi:hypothetical protein
VLTDLQKSRDSSGINSAVTPPRVASKCGRRLYQVHATGLIEQEGHFAATAADVSSRDDPTAVT